MRPFFKSLTKKTYLLAVLVITLIFTLTILQMPGNTMVEAHADNPGYVAVNVLNTCEGKFSEFSDIGCENEIIESRAATTGPGSYTILLVPGRLKIHKLELTRVLEQKDLSFYNWRKLVETGKVTTARKEATVTLFNSEGEVLAQWKLTNTWPCEITYEMINGAYTEKVTIAYENYQRLK